MAHNLHRRTFVSLAAAGAFGVLGISGAAGLTRKAHAAKGLGVASDDEVQPNTAATCFEKAAAYLRTQQDAASGGWSVKTGGPEFPAISGLVLRGLLMNPKANMDDMAISGGIKYILGCQQTDGSIHSGLLPSYNTAICLSALASIPNPDARIKEAIDRAKAFVRTLQFGEEAKVPAGVPDVAEKVERSHAFYGGVGYGKHGRPDLSNTAFFVEALRDSGVDTSDAAYQRALVFLQRTQMLETVKGPDGKPMQVNDMAYAKGSQQGGFIYATSENKDTVGSGQSFAGTMEETLSDGTVASRLRAYGSMTYSGFKSYLYAGLSKTDPRVVAAREWIRRNYTLEENPGVGTDGLYYFLLVFARAMAVYGENQIVTVDAKSGQESTRIWRNDLATRLAKLQKEDGSFTSVDDRWMENNPVLIAAYSLGALGHAAFA